MGFARLKREKKKRKKERERGGYTTLAVSISF